MVLEEYLLFEALRTFFCYLKIMKSLVRVSSVKKGSRFILLEKSELF